jgi:biopolymer transport protein ExbD
MYVSSPIPHKKARIEIIPLIDIMFFLLASFMMVSLSQVHMKGMKVNLPTGSSGETQTKREYISVSVDKDGHYFIAIRFMETLFICSICFARQDSIRSRSKLRAKR